MTAAPVAIPSPARAGSAVALAPTRAHVNHVQPLSGLDASFLYSESPQNPMHTLKALVLELPERCASEPFEHVRRELRARFHLLPTLRMRLMQAPLSIGHPFWYEDPDVDPADHLDRVVLEPGAGLRGLEAVMARAGTVPLDRSRPLWSLTVVEGLAERRIALVVKLHHALADGAAFAHLVERLTSPHPARAVPPTRASPPSAPRLLALALRSRAGDLLRVGPLVGRTAVGLTRRVRREVKLRIGDPHVFGGPPTSFARPLTSRRSVALATLPLAELRHVKERAHCGMHDVLLAVCAGALRAYLAERGEAHDRPLVSAVPFGLPDDHLWGNRVSNLIVTLHVERADVLDRLTRTIESSSAAKELHELLGKGLLQDWTQLVRRRPIAWTWRYVVRRLRRTPVDLIVSSVAGAKERVRIGDARLVDIFSVGPLLETTGLNLTFWTYADHVSACLLGCPDHGTDVDALARLLVASTHELAEAV